MLPLLSLILPVFAKKIPGDVVVEPAARWETRHGAAETRLELVRSMVDAGAVEAALQVITTMRKEGQAGPELDVMHARALRMIGMLDDAEALLEDALAKNKKDPALHNERGILAMDRKDVEKAIAAFERAAQLAPEDADYKNNLGFALMAAGRHAEAVDPLRAALRIDSSRNRTRNNLGFALVTLGRTDEAFRLFKSVQTEADAHYNVGVGLERTGHVDEAASSYKAAVDANPSHYLALRALERIAQEKDT